MLFRTGLRGDFKESKSSFWPKLFSESHPKAHIYKFKNNRNHSSEFLVSRIDRCVTHIVVTHHVECSPDQPCPLLLLRRLRLPATFLLRDLLSSSALTPLEEGRPVLLAGSSSRIPLPPKSEYFFRPFSLDSVLLLVLLLFAPMLNSISPSPPSRLCLRLIVRPSTLPPLRSRLTPWEALKRIVSPSLSLCVLTSLPPRRSIELLGLTSLPSRLPRPEPVMRLLVLLLVVFLRIRFSESAVMGSMAVPMDA